MSGELSAFSILPPIIASQWVYPGDFIWFILLLIIGHVCTGSVHTALFLEIKSLDQQGDIFCW